MPPRGELIPEPTAMEMICQFNKLKPSNFEIGTDLMAYEAWLQRKENLLEIMECPERFKVHLATYQFQKEVEFWWRTVKPRVGEPANTMSGILLIVNQLCAPILFDSGATHSVVILDLRRNLLASLTRCIYNFA